MNDAAYVDYGEQITPITFGPDGLPIDPRSQMEAWPTPKFANTSSEYWAFDDPRYRSSWLSYAAPNPYPIFQGELWEGLLRQSGFTGPMYQEKYIQQNGEQLPAGPEFTPQARAAIDALRARGYDVRQKHPDRDTYNTYYGIFGPQGLIQDVKIEGDDGSRNFLKFLTAVGGGILGSGALGDVFGGGATSVPSIGAGIAEGMAPGVLAPASAAELAAVNALTGVGGALTAADLTSLPTNMLGSSEAAGAGGDILAGGAETVPAGLSSADRAALLSDAGYAPGMTGAQTSAYDAIIGATGSPGLANVASNIAGPAGSLLDKAINFVTSPQGSAIVGGAANLIGGVAGGQAAVDAAQTQAAAASEATQLQRDIYNKFLEMNKPYYEAGVNALGKLTRGEITAEPGYGFRLGEGMKALERLQASRGQLLGGGAIKAGQRYAQDLASQEYGNAYNRLANLAGIGQTAAGAAGAAGQNYASQAGELGLQSANALTQGRIGRTSSYTGGLMGAANALQNYTAQQQQKEFIDFLRSKYMPG